MKSQQFGDRSLIKLVFFVRINFHEYCSIDHVDFCNAVVILDDCPLSPTDTNMHNKVIEISIN